MNFVSIEECGGASESTYQGRFAGTDPQCTLWTFGPAAHLTVRG